MNVRIAIGACRCSDSVKSRDENIRDLCERIQSKIEMLRTTDVSTLRELPAMTTEVHRRSDRDLTINTYRCETLSDEHLIVVQGFVPSWRWPRYFGPAGVGHMFAEGLTVSPAGSVNNAGEALLWEYR